MEKKNLDYNEVLEKLKKGNSIYVNCIKENKGILTRFLLKEKQHPFAIIITCSDSRVIPEYIFNQNIGDLFVIRVAGNVIDNTVLGSIEYALEHFNVSLVLVLGHNYCGAVEASFSFIDDTKRVSYIQKEIVKARNEENNAYNASLLNVLNSKKIIKENLSLKENQHVIGGIYDIKTGIVEFIND